MLKTRVLTAIALAAIFLGALFGLPPHGWAVFALLLVGIGAYEWAGFARLAPSGRIAFALATGAAGGAVAVGSGLAGGLVYSPAVAIAHGLAVAFWLIVVPLWLRSRPGAPAALILVLGWIVLLPAYWALVQIRNLGPITLLMFMIVVWIADIAAYFAGRAWGRHKLAPNVSPGKSWEGVAGAVVATGVYAGCWALLAPQHVPAGLHGAVLLGFVWFLTGISVLGDLFESAMKRQVGIKDSGRIFPGHGGVLDRIDALTPVLPAAALLVSVTS